MTRDQLWDKLWSCMNEAANPKWSLNHRFRIARMALETYENLREMDNLYELDKPIDNPLTIKAILNMLIKLENTNAIITYSTEEVR